MTRDRYDNLRETYDSFVKRIVPQLTGAEVNDFLLYLNNMVSLQRPSDWAQLSSPREVLAMTSDEEHVVYGEVGRFGFYHAILSVGIALRPNLENIVHNNRLLKKLKQKGTD